MKATVLFILFVLASKYSIAQTIKRMDDQTWNAINDEVFSQYLSNGLKGISVAVVYGGQVAYANAFGVKNANGDPFTINTKSLLASVSKPITAVMAMRLIQNGDIGLNDPISNYVTGYGSSGITIRHLLCHQSGIGHYDDCPGGYSGPFDAEESHDVVLECERCLTPPGSGTIYSTFGTTLLGVIIEDVALDVYNGIFQTLYYSWLHSPGNLGTLEPAYDSSDPALAQGSEDEVYWDDIGWKLPAGGFISNITDLANFARGMLNNTFINQQTFDMMKVGQATTGTPNHECGDLEDFVFGLGFGVRGAINADTFRMSHSGDNSHGYGAFIAIYPNANAAVVILTNTGDAGGTMRNIVDDIEDVALCPSSRNFTNNISWTEPRIFEGENITMQSELTSTYGQEYILDAGNWVKLLPGFKVSAGKMFKAMTEGCGGNTIPD
jgi:CubicO group peptidase (beta-lactamase class C family)